ncbi:MAG TPA: hypothetical protein VGI06_10405 [Acidimicrobiales bacterium]|jgi:hypothetical protein
MEAVLVLVVMVVAMTAVKLGVRRVFRGRAETPPKPRQGRSR